MEQDVLTGVHALDLRQTVKDANERGWRVVQVITHSGHWALSILIERETSKSEDI